MQRAEILGNDKMYDAIHIFSGCNTFRTALEASGYRCACFDKSLLISINYIFWIYTLRFFLMGLYLGSY